MEMTQKSNGFDTEVKPIPDINTDKKTQIVNTDIPYEKIKNLYHSICISYPKISKFTDKRKSTLKARYEEYDSNIKIFEELFTKAESSDFLKGKKGKWKANFDWLINCNNMVKVLEGNYENKTNDFWNDLSEEE